MNDVTPSFESLRAPRRPVVAVIIGAAALCSIAFFVYTFGAVHPEAALDLRVDAAEAVKRAGAEVTRLGFDVSNYRHATQFTTDSNTKNFLEKQLGMTEANRLMAGPIRTWYWWVRFFVPQQEEEFSVGIGTDGRLVYFAHTLEEARPGASIDSNEAREIATNFLAGLSHIRVDQYDEISNTQRQLPARRQHNLTWKLRQAPIAGAEYRLSVEVDGDAVGYYAEYLHTPESWALDEGRQEARRGLLVRVASIAESILWIALLVTGYLEARRRTLRFRAAFAIGGVASIIALLNWINYVPSSWMRYDTNDPVRSHYIDLMIGALNAVVSQPIPLLILVVAADAAGRRTFPRLPSISLALKPRFWASRPLMAACAIGLALACIHTAYYSAFYLLAGRLGAWAPLYENYTSSLGTPMPWIYPLTTGFGAAAQEELLFRLFAVSLLTRLTGQRWLAVVVPAVIWAFLHSHYPQEPIYIRGVELTAVGIVYGIVFLRYGIVATLISHYAYNALAGATVLLQTDSMYTRGSAVAVLAAAMLSLIPGFWALLRRRRLLELGDVLALAGPGVVVPLKPVQSTRTDPALETIEPAARRTLIVLTVAACIGISIATFTPRPMKFGGYVRNVIDSRQARSIADSYLRSKGIDIGRYRATVGYYNGLRGVDADYLAQHLDLDALNRTFRDRFPDRPNWSVRYFRPLDPEGYAVSVSTNGSVSDFRHWLPEDRPGARLAREDARARAQQWMTDEFSVNLDGYNLIDSSSTDRPNRTDHYFVWEDRREPIGQSAFRISVGVLGDQPINVDRYLHIPEEWDRKRGETTPYAIAGKVLAAVLGIFVLVSLIAIIVGLSRRHLFRFRVPMAVGAFMALLSIVRGCFSLNMFWASYGTAVEPAVYITQQLLKIFVVEPIGMFLGVTAVVAFADAMLRRAFPTQPTFAAWLRWPFGNGAAHARLLWAEAIVLATLFTGVGVGIDTLLKLDLLAKAGKPVAETIFDNAPKSAVVGGGYVTYLPAAYESLGIVFEWLGPIFLIVAFVAALRAYCWTPSRMLLMIIVFVTLGSLTQSHSAVELPENAGIGAAGIVLIIGVVYVMVRWIFRANLPGYALAALFGEIADKVADLYFSANAFDRSNGFALACATGLFCAAGFVVYAHERKRAAIAEPPAGRASDDLTAA